jgi:hypothetical protein
MASPVKTSEFLVLAIRGDRLTSRLEGLIASWRMARGLGRHLVFTWPKPFAHEEADYLASSIFDLEGMAGSPESHDLKILEQRGVPRQGALDLRTEAGWPDALDRKKLAEWPAHIFVNARHDMEFKGEDPEQVRRERKELFKLLRTQPVVTENLERAMDWIGPKPFTAVHIRRGDLMTKLGKSLTRFRAWPPEAPTDTPEFAAMAEELRIGLFHFTMRVAPLESYAKAARQSPPAERILVFSDSDAVALEFQQSLPEREVLRADSFAAPLNEIQRAWLDVLLMMRARKIIGTGSSFSNFASFYGEVPLIDVRAKTAKAKIVAFFFQSFATYVDDSPALQKRCARILNTLIDKQFRWRYWPAVLRLYKRAYFLLHSK